ncbi:hypothetical protein BGX31_000476, partial [Mortierella sp. GBA43]
MIEPRYMLEPPPNSTLFTHTLLPDALLEEQPKIDFPNLTHLFLKTDPARIGPFRTGGIPNHMENILIQCSTIQDLEWDAGDLVMTTALVESVLKHTTNNLRRLSISGNFQEHQMTLYRYLIEAHLRCQQHPLRQLAGMSIANPMEATTRPTSGGSIGCGQLEELVLRTQRSLVQQLDPTAFRGIRGTIPLRSLTLVGFNTEINYQHVNLEMPPDLFAPSADGTVPTLFEAVSVFMNPGNFEQREDDAVLAMVEKCPQLEKLHVTFDISKIMTDTYYHDFQYGLANLNQRRAETSTRDDFVQILVSSCPNLRDIEFGMMRHLAPHHWNELTRSYGQQLESFSVWGNHGRFDTSAFMALIGLPSTHPSRDQPHCLTRLNINGLDRLYSCAWMALQHLPHLKEFRARDVPLNARQLVTKDGWVCKGLEVLEICIAIYKKQQPKKTAWHWCDSE